MYQNSRSFAEAMDEQDNLYHLRSYYHHPKIDGVKHLYFCGNSLGLQPKAVKKSILRELKDWKKWGVEGHINAKRPWLTYHHQFTNATARLVGALPREVVVMNSLTANLHFLMASFYRPEGKRQKILVEAGCFPSDLYAVQGQARWHGLNPDEVIVELASPDAERVILRTEEIVEAIRREGDELALILLGGVNYYSGQAFDIATITKAAHEVGAIAGWDLAHAAGNLVLQLHEWEVDFAAWCTYKYLNSGPGGTSGVFVHEKHIDNPNIVRLSGWWGTNEQKRFQMLREFEPMPDAGSWQVSNAQIFSMAPHLAALELFDEVGMEALRTKSIKLTGFLEFLLNEIPDPKPFRIITPNDPAQRGCQLSLQFSRDGKALFEHLTQNHIIVDWREPDVIRISPVPMYNSFEDVYKLVQCILSSGLVGR